MITKGTVPECRHGHSGVTINTNIIYFAGRGNGFKKFFEDLIIFDTLNYQWIYPMVEGQKPFPRYYHASLAIHEGSELLVFGGIRPKEFIHYPRMYHLKTKTNFPSPKNILREELRKLKDQLVVVYYHAPWSPQCVQYQDFLFLLCQEHPDVFFLKVEAEGGGIDICKERSIETFPSFEFFKNGKSLVVRTNPPSDQVQSLIKTLKRSKLGERWIYNILPDNWLFSILWRVLTLTSIAFISYSIYSFLYPTGRNGWLVVVVALVIGKRYMDKYRITD